MGWHLRRYLETEEGKVRKYSEWELISKIYSLISPYKYQLLLILLLSLTRVGVGLMLPYLTKLIIDSIELRNMTLLTLSIIFFLLTVILNWGARASNTYLTSKVGRRVICEIRDRMYNHLLKLRLSYFSREKAGTIVSRITNDVDALGDVVTSGVIDVISDVVSLLGAVFIMVKLSVDLSLVVFALVPLILLTSYYFAVRARKAYRETRKKIASVTSKIEEDIAGAAIIRTFAHRKRRNIKEFEKINRENLQANLEATKVVGFINPILNTIRALGYAIILWYGGMLVVNDQITLGTLVAFYGYMDRFFSPILMLTMFYGTLQSAFAAAERIFEFLEEEEEPQEGVEIKDVKGEIVYQNVTFGYEPNQPVVKDINIKIKPGEIVAIVGPTGAGKTTLMNLLLRFYDPWKGKVLLDGIDLRRIKPSSLRKYIGLVLQEPILFSGTVLDNIRVAKPDADEKQVKEIIEKLGLKDFLESLPEGIHTRVIEGGKNLSVGQRQLISFSRAMLRDSKILVMDEATSSVDPFTEAKLQTALRKLIAGKTCIIIAHRLSTVKIADRIIVLDEGRVVEEGTHEELLKKGGLYAKLYRIQFAVAQ